MGVGSLEVVVDPWIVQEKVWKEKSRGLRIAA